MSDPVNLTPGGPPETILPQAPADAVDALASALAGRDKAAVAAVVADFPRFIDGWARLAELTDIPIEAYAYARVGYHRGLDALRGSGWRGSGYVRWRHDSNRGFLRALARLRDAAGRIGEDDEVARISQFLVQLDPEWDDALLD